jgi:hypothetical protein
MERLNFKDTKQPTEPLEVRRCDERDFEVIWDIINDGARALGGCGLGDPVLPKARLSNRGCAREGPAAQEILDHTRTPD